MSLATELHKTDSVSDLQSSHVINEKSVLFKYQVNGARILDPMQQCGLAHGSCLYIAS